jgi:ketosteroid isomerase-like protein
MHISVNNSGSKKWLLIAGLCVSASCLSMNGLADSREMEEVRASVEQLRIAMINGDEKALKQLSSPLLSYGHSGGHIEDQQAFIEKIVSGKSDFVTMELADQTIVLSGDTALVRHNLNADIKDGGVPNKIHLGVLLVWQKQAGDWKLLARQAIKYASQAQ